MTLEKARKLVLGDVVAFEQSNRYIEELVSIEKDETRWRLLHADKPAFTSKIVPRYTSDQQGYCWKKATLLGSHVSLSGDRA